MATRSIRVAAVEHMTKAVALSESSPDLWVRLGQMHLEQGYYARARENADAALRESGEPIRPLGL